MRPSSQGPQLEKVLMDPADGERTPATTASFTAPMVMMFFARELKVIDWKPPSAVRESCSLPAAQNGR